MVKKLVFMAIGALVFSGCGDTVSDALNGSTTAEDIKSKSNVLIVTGIDSISCTILGVGVKDKYPNGDTLIADSGVTCATYSKDEYSCKIQTLEEVKAEYDNASVNSVKSGDKACVIGGDATIN